MGRYKKDNKIIETRLNYRVNIIFYNDIMPVSSNKHLKRFTPSKRRFERYISNIEKIGNEEVQCIKVSAEDSLYITDNYILTHNTSTLIDVVKEIRKIDKDCKILYLVFNKSMVEDSKKKFDQENLNVECQTIHGWALKRFSLLAKDEITIMANIDYGDYSKVKLKQNKYKYSKYKNILEMFKEYGLTFDNLSTFCYNMKSGFKGQSKYNLEKLGIRSYEVEFFEELYKYFLKNNKYLHSMYLKEYACNTADKVKGYKFLLVDEFQDTNIFGMNVIKKIDYSKIYVVGDIFQAIYGFNRCINGFDKLEGKTYPLSTSFRFNDNICKLANDILDANFEEFKYGSIKNFHNKTEIENKKEKAILFRKNASLFEYAVNLINNADNITVKFIDVVNGNKVGDFDSVFSEMLYFYDQLLESSNSENLSEFRQKFRIVSHKSINEYVKIAEKENLPLYKHLYFNKQVLSLDMLRLFNFFLLNENNIVEILEKVRKSEECENPDKIYILMTAHSSKGMEFDHVKIADDAWKMNTSDEKSLCYVAITRAKYRCDCEPILRLLEEKKGCLL